VRGCFSPWGVEAIIDGRLQCGLPYFKPYFGSDSYSGISHAAQRRFLHTKKSLNGVNKSHKFESDLKSIHSLHFLQLKQLASIIKEQANGSLVIFLPNGEKRVLSREFVEWLRGFTDAEGSFFIFRKSSSFSFEYVLRLHIDDREVLKYIQNTLGMGTHGDSNKTSQTWFRVGALREVEIIIAIFFKYNLNTTKHLNFLAFTQAFILYTESNSREARLKLKPKLDEIINMINSKRTNFYLDPSTHNFNISANWLLGFVEGDGSFHVGAKDNLIFSMAQKDNKALLDEIKNFLLQVPRVSALELGMKDDLVYVYPQYKERNIWQLVVSRRDFIEHVLIPLFDGLIFRSKKYLDYCDWKSILLIRKKGQHYTPTGKKLIELIKAQINKNRLSTSGKPIVDRALLYADINKLLSIPSNYEDREDGKIWIRSEKKYLGEKAKGVEVISFDGLILKTFNSISECAKFLGLSQQTLSYRLKQNNPCEALFENKSCWVKRK
jgi:hypothetical protein